MSYFTLVGNIGAGKTTLLEKLKTRLADMSIDDDVAFVEEPVEQWQECVNCDGKGKLETYYADPKTNGFMFELFALNTRAIKLKNVSHYPVIISDRDPTTSLKLFGNVGFENGTLSIMEFKTLTQFAEHMVSLQPRVIVFLNCPVEECMKRQALRDKAPVPANIFDALDKQLDLLKRQLKIDKLEIDTSTMDGLCAGVDQIALLVAQNVAKFKA